MITRNTDSMTDAELVAYWSNAVAPSLERDQPENAIHVRAVDLERLCLLAKAEAERREREADGDDGLGWPDPISLGTVRATVTGTAVRPVFPITDGYPGMLKEFDPKLYNHEEDR